jgi:hypothetical protein
LYDASQCAQHSHWPGSRRHSRSKSKPTLIIEQISLNTRHTLAKGWTLVDQSADVAIMAIETTQTQRTLDTFYDGFGGGWGWRGFGGFGDATTTEHDYKEGTLVVDMYDAKSKKLIWRGSTEDSLSGKPANNEKNLEKGVAKMFKAFPPGWGRH